MSLFFAYGFELDRAKLLAAAFPQRSGETEPTQQAQTTAGDGDDGAAEPTIAPVNAGVGPKPDESAGMQKAAANSTARVSDCANREPVGSGFVSNMSLVFRQEPDKEEGLFSDLVLTEGAHTWGLLFDWPDDVIKALSSVLDGEREVSTQNVTVDRLCSVSRSATEHANLTLGAKVDACCLLARNSLAPSVQPDDATLRRLLGCCIAESASAAALRSVLGPEPLSVEATVRKTGKDLTGQTITQVYYKAPPRYAIYQTDERVSVQYADDLTEAASQRKDMAQLNPLRSQVTGLIDGWLQGQCAWLPWFAKKLARCNAQKAARYNARVAAALNQLLEKDIPSALSTMEGIKTDILSERASRGRLQFLVGALGTACVFCGVFWLLKTFAFPEPNPTHALWLAARAGTIGAFFSIAMNIRDRQVQIDLLPLDNLTDSALRVTVGAFGAGVLYCLLGSSILPMSALGFNATGNPLTWQAVLVSGFLAGFCERLVSNIFSKIGNDVAPAPTPPPSSTPSATGGASQAGAMH